MHASAYTSWLKETHPFLQARLAAMDTPIASVMLWMLQSNMTWSLLQSQTITHAMLQTEATAISAAILLFFLLCVVAMLQRRLTKAAGHWLQHKAPMIEPRNSRLLSRTSTSAAELYYLRHTRSCAATATGNKGSHLQESSALEISGADVTARLLQSI